MIVRSPKPLSCNQSIIVALASATCMPSSEISSLAELIATPSPVNAWSSGWPGVGCTVRTTGRSNFAANSQSRTSCPGTAMMAPVP